MYHEPTQIIGGKEGGLFWFGLVPTKSPRMFNTLPVRTRPQQAPTSAEDHKLCTYSVILCSFLPGVC